jgi:hypothetical protein
MVPSDVAAGLRIMAEVSRHASALMRPEVLKALGWIDQLAELNVGRVERGPVPARRWRWSCTVSDPAGMVASCDETQDGARVRALARFELEMGRAPDVQLMEVAFSQRPRLKM